MILGKACRLFLAYSLILGASSGALRADSDDPGPTEIRIAMFSDIRSLYPGVNRDAYSDDVLINVVEPLVVHRDDLTIAPMAAESFIVSDDLKTYSFTLRKELKYHNGEAVRASHFKAVWEKMLDPQTGFQCLPFYNGKMGSKIVSIEVQDPYDITFQLSKPSAVFLEQLAYVQCPVSLMHPDSWDEDGNFVSPIATGPYKFKEWKKGRYVLLEKFADYVPRSDAPTGLAGRKEALADSARFLIIGDQMAAKAALVSGQIDIVGSLTPIMALELRRNKRVKVLDVPGLSRRTLLIQTNAPLLSDIRIRQAMAHALDTKTFIEVASLGYATHNPSTIPADSFNHTDIHAQSHTYDPELSRKLLAEAGYNGQEIVIQTTKAEQSYFDTAMIAEAMFREVGLNIRIQVLELASLLGNYFEGEYQVMAFEYSPRFTAFMSYQSMIGDKEATPNRWGDLQARNWMIEAATQRDPDKRQAIYDKIHTLMMSQVPVINLYNATNVEGIRNDLEGYVLWPGSKTRLWNVPVHNDKP